MNPESTDESGSGPTELKDDGGKMEADVPPLSRDVSTADAEHAPPVQPVQTPASAAVDSNSSQTLPCDDGFVPDISQMRLGDGVSQHYWEEILGRCNDQTRLNSSSTEGRGVFAFGSVVVKSDHLATEATGDYSAMDANECAAVEVLGDVLSDIQLPRCYLRRKLHGRDVCIQSRVPGTTLQAAWPNLAREQKINYKEQARNIMGRIHQVKSNRSRPSYFVEANNPRVSHKLDPEEYDILFEDTESKSDDDLAAVHNSMIPSNILVEDDRIVGIVGWSNAGYFGWERAKAVHSALRCSTSDPTTDDSESDVVWDDLYDVAVDVAKPLLHGNANDNIKTEAANQSLENVPRASTTDTAGIAGDEPTPNKKIADLKGESTSRAASSEGSSPSPSAKDSKKRVAPAATTRKGGAKGKPGPKKRKLNDATKADATTTTSSSRRGSLTPSSSRRGKGSAGRQLKRSSLSVASSPVPDDNVADGADEDGDEDDDVDPSEVYCICRKPDNHTWMIGCDGGCEDWFHGKCINIKQADADLIDKYICPSCEKKYNTRTTWKPMCRLSSCRQPARVDARPPSKYCSDEHGREFMRLKVNGGHSRSNSRGAAEVAPSTRSRASSFGPGKGRRRGSHVDGGEEDASNDEDEDEDEEMDGEDEDADNSGSRGGVLTKSDLKSAVSLTGSAEEFRNLGGSVLMSQPPEIRSRFGDPNTAIDEVDLEARSIEFTPEERQQIQTLRDQKARLRNHSDMLRDRDKFVGLVRQQAKHILERLRNADAKGATAWKDICGFDPRLSWSDEEFDDWRKTEGGKKALAGGLEPPASYTDAGLDGGGDTQMSDAKEDSVSKVAGDVCVKRRCEQHKQWMKVQQQDILFEQATVREDLAKCEKNAKEVIERVVMRIYGSDNGASVSNGV